MHKKFLAIAAASGGIGVATGAFGAHGLQKMTTDESTLHAFNTGVQYQIYHALALLAVALLAAGNNNRLLQWSGRLFILGMLLFSGSLYLITFLKIQGNAAVKWIGPVTPLGGLCFIAGWLLLLFAALQKEKK